MKKLVIGIRRKSKSVKKIAPTVKKSKPNSLFKSPSAENPFFPRRLRPGGIRLFDLARFADGSEIEFLISPPIDTTGATPFDTPKSQTLGDYHARDEFLFDLTEENNFEQIFFEIKAADGDFYRLMIFDAFDDSEPDILTSDSELWTAKGFKKSTDIAAIVLDSNENSQNQEWRLNLFPQIYFNSPLDRVTAEYDYSAAAVEDFELKNGDSLFWLPRIPCHHVLAQYPNQTGNDYSEFRRCLGNQFRFAPRQFYIENGSDPEIDVTIAGAGGGFPPEYYPFTYQAAMWHQSLNNQRCFQGYTNYTNGEIVVEEITPPNVLPNPPYTPSSGERINVNIFLDGEPNGSLVAIVKRGNNFFYLWRTGF